MKKPILITLLAALALNLNLVINPDVNHYVIGLKLPNIAVTVNEGEVTFVGPWDIEI